MKKIIIVLILVNALWGITASAQISPGVQLWRVVNGVLQPVNSSWTINVPASGVTATSTFSGNILVSGNFEVSGVSLLNLVSSGNFISTGSVTATHFIANSGSATSTIAGGLTIEGSGFVYDFSTGNVGIGTTGPGQKLELYTSEGAKVRFNNSAHTWDFGMRTGTNYLDLQYDGSDRVSIDNTGNVGIGTTTPTNKLTITDSSASQLTLSADAGIAQWAFRNAGGNLYFATTTVGGNNATTSVAALEIRNNGSMYAPFTLSSGVAQTGYWCYDANGQFVRDSVACLVSAKKYKKDINPIDVGLEELLKLEPVNYYLKTPLGENDKVQQFGFIADDVEKIDSRLVTYDSNGEIRGFRYEQFTAVITKAIQELNDKVEGKVILAKRSAEENWQWIVMSILFLWVIRLEIKIRRM